MSKRLDNDGGAYNFYHRDAQVFEPVEEAIKESQFLSYNQVENGVKGSALGDGTYLHQGQVQENKILAQTVEYNNPVKMFNKSRLESSLATEGFEDFSKSLEERIVSAQPSMDFNTGKGELILHYANGKTKVVKRSNFEIASWLMNKTAQGLID